MPPTPETALYPLNTTYHPQTLPRSRWNGKQLRPKLDSRGSLPHHRSEPYPASRRRWPQLGSNQRASGPTEPSRANPKTAPGSPGSPGRGSPRLPNSPPLSSARRLLPGGVCVCARFQGVCAAPWRVCKGGTVAPLADHGGGSARQFAEPALIALHSSVWRRVLANHHRLRRLRRVPRQRRAPSPARPRRLSIFSAGGPAPGSLPTAAPEPRSARPRLPLAPAEPARPAPQCPGPACAPPRNAKLRLRHAP